MIDKSFYFLPAKTNLEKIKEINDYVGSILRHYFPLTTGCNNYIKTNLRANTILSDFNVNETVTALDSYLAFWIYEVSKSPNDQSLHNNGLESKLTAIRNELRKKPRAESLNFGLEPLTRLLAEHQVRDAKYVYENDHAVILTAIPVEFKSMLRKFEIILAVFDRSETERIVDPSTDQEGLRKRNNLTWVDGVIIRNDKWVKVRLVLTEEYGSESSQACLRDIAETEYSFPNEILVVGVAGQLDKTNKVKFGDLVISDKYFVGYAKATETDDSLGNIINDVSYDDKDARELSDDYDVPSNFEWEKWQPTRMLVTKPPPKNNKQYRQVSRVFKGPFVSVPGVVKQRFRKTRLQEEFIGALAIEMEAHGCHHFSKKKAIKLKVIKGICDWSNHEKEKSWQPYCADLASEFAVDYLIAKYGKMLIDN